MAFWRKNAEERSLAEVQRSQFKTRDEFRNNHKLFDSSQSLRL